jgi:hypothetical protein
MIIDITVLPVSTCGELDQRLPYLFLYFILCQNIIKFAKKVGSDEFYNDIPLIYDFSFLFLEKNFSVGGFVSSSTEVQSFNSVNEIIDLFDFQ